MPGIFTSTALCFWERHGVLLWLVPSMGPLVTRMSEEHQPLPVDHTVSPLPEHRCHHHLSCLPSLFSYRWSCIPEDAATIELCSGQSIAVDLPTETAGINSKIWFLGLPLTVKWVLANYWAVGSLWTKWEGSDKPEIPIRTNFVQLHSTGNYSVFLRL